MNRILPVVIVLLALGLIFIMITVEKVPLDKIGVKVKSFGSDGIVKEDLQPGYYFIMPGNRLYLLDPTVQTYEVGSRAAQRFLLVAKDQYTTEFDITIVYRIKPGSAHLAADDIGFTEAQMNTLVWSKSKEVLWDALGRLNTQEFYDVEKREAARSDAKKQLALDLDGIHLELIDILFRAITYDTNLEKILVQKQLFDQQRALNVEKTLLEAELEKTQSIEKESAAKEKVIHEERVQEIENIVANTDARINEISADAQLEAQTLISDADRYRRTKESEGELARTQAQAKGEKAINEAYLGLGGQAYITRQMIDALDFGEIEVNTNKINPFDVNQLLAMLGLDARALEAEATKD